MVAESEASTCELVPGDEWAAGLVEEVEYQHLGGWEAASWSCQLLSRQRLDDWHSDPTARPSRVGAEELAEPSLVTDVRGCVKKAAVSTGVYKDDDAGRLLNGDLAALNWMRLNGNLNAMRSR